MWQRVTWRPVAVEAFDAQAQKTGPCGGFFAPSTIQAAAWQSCGRGRGVGARAAVFLGLGGPEDYQSRRAAELKRPNLEREDRHQTSCSKVSRRDCTLTLRHDDAPCYLVQQGLAQGLYPDTAP